MEHPRPVNSANSSVLLIRRGKGEEKLMGRSYKRVLQKTKEQRKSWESSHSNPSSSSLTEKDQHHSKHLHHHCHSSGYHKVGSLSPEQEQGLWKQSHKSSAAIQNETPKKKPKLESKPSNRDGSSINQSAHSGGTDNSVLIRQLKEVMSLKRLLQQRDQTTLENDKTLTELKAGFQYQELNLRTKMNNVEQLQAKPENYSNRLQPCQRVKSLTRVEAC